MTVSNTFLLLVVIDTMGYTYENADKALLDALENVYTKKSPTSKEPEQQGQKRKIKDNDQDESSDAEAGLSQKNMWTKKAKVEDKKDNTNQPTLPANN